MSSADRRLAATASKLDALSPLKVLGRGYAIGYTADGQALDSVSAIKVGDDITWKVSDGRIMSRVVDIQEES